MVESTEKHSGRLLAWLIFVGALALIAYAGRFYGPAEPENLAYKYSSSVAALIQYAFILGILLLIARGLPKREVFALRQPDSWPRALGLAVVGIVVIYLGSFAYEQARRYLATGGAAGIPVVQIGSCFRVPRWALLELALTGRLVRLCDAQIPDIGVENGG